MEENMKRILVVDDEQDLCEILKFNLETEGYEVETANSAEEALEMDIASFDLLLLDVMMGGMSGFQLAKHLKGEKFRTFGSAGIEASCPSESSSFSYSGISP